MERIHTPMPRPVTPRRRMRGFSMTELAATVAISSILMAIAVPSFNSVIAGQRALTSASDLYITLAKTRSAAVSLNNSVTLQPKAGGWAAGWQILDVNNNVLDDHAALKSVTVVGPAAAVSFGASGRLPAGAVAPVFVISSMVGTAAINECVSVSLSGRPYMKPAAAC